MKKFKLLSTSLIVALSFASSQASYGMEENENKPTSVKKTTVPRKGTIEWRHSDKVGTFSKLPQYFTQKILDLAIYNQAIEDGEHPINIELTCKTFRSILATDTDNFNKNIKLDKKERSPLPFNTRLSFLEGLKLHDDITTPEQIKVFNQIYNGKLIYRPNPNSGDGKIELPISGLKHPFKGEFDLLKCGDTGKYLSINMGYRKEINPKNHAKVEIWVAPRFLIERELNTTAGHFRKIMETWKQEQAPIGMFWTRGIWDNLGWYDHLTTHTMDQLGNNNLENKWGVAHITVSGGFWLRHTFYPCAQKVSHFVCELK